MPTVPFGVHAYKNRDSQLAPLRCVNLYAENLAPESKAAMVLHGTPGASQFVDTSDTEIRALEGLGGTLYAVGGSEVWKVTSSGALTSQGTIGSGRVRLAASDTQLVIVGAGVAKVVSSSGMVDITDADYPGAFDVTQFDRYHIFAGDDGKWFICEVANATSFNALDFQQEQGALVGVEVSSVYLWVFGVDFMLAYFNSGDADFPFSRVDGSRSATGCAATGSIARLRDTIFFLGNDKIVYALGGIKPERISTHAIENDIETYPTVSDAEGWTYSQNGHDFYVLTFPTANKTWVFDLATKLWHERQSYGLGRWRACCGIEIYGKVYVGDSQSGKILDLSLDTYTEDGGTIQRIGTAHVGDLYTRATIHEVQIKFLGGQGLNTGQGSDPQAMLRTSKDGGKTFGNERWRPIGRIGEYANRAIWRGLGQARNWVLEVTISDPVKVAWPSELRVEATKNRV